MRDTAQWVMALSEERKRQREMGFTAEHDDEKGADHLIFWALQYLQRGEEVKAGAILIALSEHLRREEDKKNG